MVRVGVKKKCSRQLEPIKLCENESRMRTKGKHVRIFECEVA